MGRFEDRRGVIQDLLGGIDAVTEIRSRAGAVRGNHVHHHTTQWTYIVEGHLRIVTRDPGGGGGDRVYYPGEMACEEPGVSHAWEALTDVVCLVFSKGPRSGDDYESDTVRLTGADRLL